MPRKSNNDQNFIEKMHRYISQPAYTFIEWAPENKGFIVNDEKAFTSQILEKKFGIGRFDSFIRKLNKFGFKRSKVSKAKIKFFHKEFTKDGKSIGNIKKLTKQEALPKHIKLRMMREKLGSESLSEENQGKSQKIDKKVKIQESQIETKKQQYQKRNEYQKNRSSSEELLKSNQKEDISIYFVKQLPQKNISTALQN